MNHIRRAGILLLAVLLLFPVLSGCAEEGSRASGSRLPAVNAPMIELLPEWAPFPSLEQKETLAVFTIPIGAADCYLITCEGHAMILDCGGLGAAPVEDYLLRLLDALGIRRLDYAISTHPHKDHTEGFPVLLSSVPADAFLTVFKHDHSSTQIKLLRAVRGLGIPIVDFVPGTPLQLGSAEISTWQMRKVHNDNDNSLILRIQYGERSILFPADIQLTTQRLFTEAHGSELQSDIMKLPHHGIGGLNGDFLRAVNPGLCFISNSEKYRGTKLQRETCDRNQVPYLFTAYVPVVMVTDGAAWQVQVWHEDSIELPWFRMITNIEDGFPGSPSTI